VQVLFFFARPLILSPYNQVRRLEQVGGPVHYYSQSYFSFPRELSTMALLSNPYRFDEPGKLSIIGEKLISLK
jgi:hypothetical protein